jgi:hypothetical protein
MEFRAEDILHPEFALYNILDDESIREDKGTREGVEAWGGGIGREHGWSAYYDDDF